MKKIDFRDKKVVIPLIAFVGILFLVFLYYNNKEEVVIVEDDNTKDIKMNVGSVSTLEADRDVGDKFSSYDAHVREQKDKYTAIQEVDEEKTAAFAEDNYTDQEKQELAELEEERRQRRLREKLGDNYVPVMKSKGYKNISNADKEADKELDDLILSMKNNSTAKEQPKESVNNNTSVSPYEDMRKQYLFLDSLQKANDPDLIAAKRAEEKDRKLLEAMEKNKLTQLRVGKLAYNQHFNSIRRQKDSEFIKAVIDENISGYAGSRIRIRLLEDIYVGNQLMKKNNYMYAIITGFNEQRVKLNIVSVMYQNEILPIKLSVYDIDGLEGLYVPSSEFREFTKGLGDATVQGMSTAQVGDGESQSQFFTSMATRLFTSTSSAISKIIKQNKAKFKYNSFIYLVDDKALEASKKSIYEQNTVK